MFLAFGEIMARLAPPDHLRWLQALPGPVQVTWGGSEANVCASLALFGHQVRYVTALPQNAIAQAVVASLRGLGIDTEHVLWAADGRLGLYFVEVGANQRSSTVVYDRQQSALSLTGPEQYNFDQALEGVQHVHVTGITPAISENAYRSSLELVRQAHQRSITVCCDLNYRKKLWRWQPDIAPRQLAHQCMKQVLPYVDLLVANEEDAAQVLGIEAEGSDVQQGRIDVAAYPQVARRIVESFPNIQHVAITLRESFSADHNHWGGMLFDAAHDRAFFAPLDQQGHYRAYQIRDIVDRVGAGDSFVAGLLHALEAFGRSELQQVLEFAVAASCLKHSIHGDFNYVTHDEVMALVAGNTTGRVQR